MRVAVLGAGVVGVTTAYFLAERGHSVTVIDRANEVASAASAANGGQLSYSFTDSLANPSLLKKLPKILLGHDPAFRIRPRVDTHLTSWGIAFLRQCTTRRSRENTVAALDIAMRSDRLLSEIIRKVPIEFSHRNAGKLVLINSQAELKLARRSSALKQEHGCSTSILSMDEVEAIESAVTSMTNGYCGAQYSKDDEVGDASAFSKNLSCWLEQNREVSFCLGNEIHEVTHQHGRVNGVCTSNELVNVDAAVVCLGAWSDQILAPLGIKTTVYPVRGYSVTLQPGSAASKVSLTDLEHKIVFSRLGDNMRIAGFADFVGFDTRNDSARIRCLLAVAKKIAPEIADYETPSSLDWGGFRPMTPNSRPLVGASKLPGLFLNTGHGMLGWTMACSTADDVAKAVSNDRCLQ